MATHYTEAFWRRAFELLEQRPRKCEACGESPFTSYRYHRRVRLCLKVGTIIEPGNLGMLCNECRPDPAEIEIPLKQRLRHILPLPWEPPPAA